MKKEFPKIKIGQVAKKVYSIDLSGGGAEPATLRVAFLADNTNYEPNSNLEYTVQIGSYYTFKGYIVSCSERNSVSSGRTKELVLIDNSIILDKYWVGLKGKDGPPQATLLNGTNFGNNRSQSSSINFGVLNPINNLSTINSSNQSTSSITIFETKGNFPNNLILLGDAIDPCKDLDSDNAIDQCDPCSQTPSSKLDCLNSRSINILDVDYTFSQLIEAAKSKGISFSSTFPSTINYRAQYKGTLREVLNSWCKDYGYSFYWNGNSVEFIDLSNGITIRDEALISEKCKIEDFSESKSIEGNARNINIAYFGKAGEPKTYDCSQSNSNSDDGSQYRILDPLSLAELFKNNTPLKSKYKNLGILKSMVTAAYYNKDLRDILCYSELLGFTEPSKVTIGKQSLMGWDIKGICHNNSDDGDVSSDYSATKCKMLYNMLLGSRNGKSAIFTAEKIADMKKNGAYFLIVDPMGTKAYDFELNLAKTFCGRYYAISTSRSDISIESPEGSAKAYPSLVGGNKFILPDVDIQHPFIKGSSISIIKQTYTNAETDFIVLDRPQIWSPSPDSDTVEDFLTPLLNYKFEEITSQLGPFRLKANHKVYLVYSFGSDGVDLSVNISENRPHPVENVQRGSSFDREKRLGIRSNKCTNIEFDIRFAGISSRAVRNKLKISMPVMDYGYLVKTKRQTTSVKGDTVKTIIPKLEIIVSDAALTTDDKYSVSCNVNVQNITDNNLSRIKRNNFNCYIDRAEIYTYADNILRDLNTNTPEIKITRNYTILGLPSTKFTPAHGLTSFSIRLDQGGTRTSLSFSNMFPVGKSETFKEQKLRNLLKDQSNKSYTNNNFK